MPERAAHFMLTMFRAARKGHFAERDPLLAELMGRAELAKTGRLHAPAVLDRLLLSDTET